ncbi:MAG TPA: hypothetical protein VFP80_11665 [Thermoanaerobaculia bacterium]|nr:hypothetical protein [Thermoanaerobaculia bacterium]
MLRQQPSAVKSHSFLQKELAGQPGQKPDISRTGDVEIQHFAVQHTARRARCAPASFLQKPEKRNCDKPTPQRVQVIANLQFRAISQAT